MKLATFQTAQGASYGIVAAKGIVDLKLLIGNRFPDLKSLIAGLDRAITGAMDDADLMTRARAFPSHSSSRSLRNRQDLPMRTAGRCRSITTREIFVSLLRRYSATIRH